ncbi:MAG: peptidylprolyl isomerase [bacterium]|jgi:cyclophilin family peptidyl-prolyl cis-trans isomerase
MNGKLLLALFCIAAVTLALTACPKKAPQPAEGGENAASPTAETVEEQPSDGDDASVENGGQPAPAEGETAESPEGGEGQETPAAENADDAAQATDATEANPEDTGVKTPLPPTGQLWSYSDLGKNQNEIITLLFETEKGTFKVEVYPEIAPNAAAAFLKYVSLGVYDGVYFHRVVKEDKLSIVQGGQPLTHAELAKTGYNAERWPEEAKKKSKLADSVGKILDEPNYARNEAGTMALGKQPSTVGGYIKDSARVDFFINLGYNEHLDRDFTVFAKVVSGMDIVNSLVQDDKLIRVVVAE